ncbi:MAG TPA: ABC transporter permease [Gemmatimonadales bacterium]|jgi:putative ABC transport system permease protein
MTRTRTAAGLTALREGVGIALDSLRANKTRAALTILGIAIGVMVVMAMSATVKGINKSLDDILAQTGPTTFFVFRHAGENQADDDDADPAWWRYPPLKPAEADQIRRLPGIEGVIMGDQDNREMYAGDADVQTNVLGRGPAWVTVAGGDVLVGRSFTNVEEEAGDKVVVLSDKGVESLFGNQNPIDRPVKIAGQQYRIIGVYRPPPNLFAATSGSSAIIPYTTFRRYVARTNDWARIIVRPAPGVQVNDAVDLVTASLRKIRGLRPGDDNNFSIITQDKILENWGKATGMFFLVMIALSAIGLLVGGIGVIAIMMISVTERTREIGVRKALGATRREILWQFLVEASTLTLIGGSVGLIFGGAAVFAVKHLSPLPATVPPWSVVAALGASILTGIVFGIVPANKASKLDPVEALRYE